NDQLLATLRDAPMGGLFELGLKGGLGADGLVVSGFIPGSQRDASFQIHLTGDAGNDRIEANLAFAAGFLGSLDFSMDGGVGDDRLTALLPMESVFGMTVNIDGALGRDTALVSRTLGPFVANCEQLTLL